MNYLLGLTIIGGFNWSSNRCYWCWTRSFNSSIISDIRFIRIYKKRIGTSLFMLLPPIGLFAALKFYNKGFVDVYASLYMAFIFTIFASITAEYSIYLNQNHLKKVFSIFTVCLGIYYFYKKIKFLKYQLILQIHFLFLDNDP